MTDINHPSNTQLGSLAPFTENPANLGVVLTYYWDTGTLAWVKGTQPSAGVGGAVTIADGADVTLGAIADAAVATDIPGTISGKLRGIVQLLLNTFYIVNDIYGAVSESGTANNTGSTVSIPNTPSTLALAAYGFRRGGTILAPYTNTATVYISLGGTASATTIPLVQGSVYELNQGSGAYSGAVNALAASGTQSLIVAEW